MLLSPAKLRKLATEIANMHIGWVAKWIGVDVLGLPEETYKQLRAAGLVTPTAATDFVLAAYRYGHASAWHETTGGTVPIEPGKPAPSLFAAPMSDPSQAASVNEMLAEAEKAGLPPLSPVQREAVDFARTRAAQYVVGLGNRVASDLTTLAIETEADVRATAKDVIATEVVRATINRETASKLASRLGDATGDWARDLQRIAETELQTANQEGWAGYITEAVGTGARVAKVPDPEACPRCRSLYLGPDGAPKLFTLAELRANGANFGRKAKEYLPTVGPVHPRCFPAGTMVSTPTGRVAIEAVLVGDAVYAPDGSTQRVERLWVNEHHGELVHLDGTSWTLACTPNHKILTSLGEDFEARLLSRGNVVLGEISTHGATTMGLRVINTVRRTAFCGLVYNLQVSNVHQYIANGIGVANCHCTLIHVPPGFRVTVGGSLTPDLGD